MKYKLRDQNSNVELIEYTQICICCGKEESVVRPSFMPTPNPVYLDKPSRLKCLLGSHHFYPEDKLEVSL